MLLAAILILISASPTESLDIESVWAGHPVGFCLYTVPPLQYAAYYNADREMTVAWRELDETAWKYRRLDNHVKWDSHNSITMTHDRDGHLHLAGNMHNDPLLYFRTTEPGNPASFERVSMVGELEQRVTYPVFYTLPDGRLMFMYRDGGSGKGNQIFNVYDEAARSWSRLLDTPIIDGEGLRNAYLDQFQMGPDGMIHVCWVWRDSYLCETNHSVSYARSPDMTTWHNAQGAKLELPIKYGSPTIVDPVPPGGGVLNGNARFGFGSEGRPVIGYMKYGPSGNSQLYAARLESGAWHTTQVTDWDYRWDFHGGGTILWEISAKRPEPAQDGGVAFQWSHKYKGSERWRLDAETLEPVEQLDNIGSGIPSNLRKVESVFPGVRKKFTWDTGNSGDPEVRYLLEWETLPQNRDRPRDKPWPEPSMLRVHAVAN